MAIYQIDPTCDERWDEFLETHPKASIFHTRGWLEALRQTYGYVPFAFTTSPPGRPLANGLPFCQISSWLTGRRLVSMPFSDHCAVLVDDLKQLKCLLDYLRDKVAVEKWRYIELRPTGSIGRDGAFDKSEVFLLHKLDLSPSLDEIFQTFHKDCVQRKIQRAVREGLVCEEGRTGLLLNKFYHLLLMTRRRHGLPAQPVRWFQNLMACLGERAKIRVASKDGQPVAGIFTLRYKKGLVYKYGCSDDRFNNLGGTQLLFWRAIQEGKKGQISEFDLGRSDYGNPGLIRFKDRWGTTRTELTYLRYPEKSSSRASEATRALMSKYLWSRAPSGILAAGGLLYKHIG
jgi:GNAT acetyltransferase-like protein